LSQFQELLASLRVALKQAPSQADSAPSDTPVLPVSAAALRARLGSRFIRQLEAVSGRVVKVKCAAGAAAAIADLCLEKGVSRVAIGAALTSDLSSALAGLAKGGREQVACGPVREADRASTRQHAAGCELGIAQAHYAIAASGTLAVVTNASNPQALSLLPPISVIIVNVDCIVEDLASALRRLAPEISNGAQLTLITGPSRTADIEKRIVLGVHGPKELLVILIWPEND
jgi:L-lactate dehydrogenase complex protein LldG